MEEESRGLGFLYARRSMIWFRGDAPPFSLFIFCFAARGSHLVRFSSRPCFKVSKRLKFEPINLCSPKLIRNLLL